MTSYVSDLESKSIIKWSKEGGSISYEFIQFHNNRLIFPQQITSSHQGNCNIFYTKPLINICYSGTYNLRLIDMENYEYSLQVISYKVTVVSPPKFTNITKLPTNIIHFKNTPLHLSATFTGIDTEIV